MAFVVKFKEYNSSNIDRAKSMRNNPTLAEKGMWVEILKYKPLGYKFTRQKPIGPFILDFYCSKLFLAIEIDGEIHKRQKEYDGQRNLFLNGLGIHLIRYRNEEIINYIDKVYDDFLLFMRGIEKTIL